MHEGGGEGGGKGGSVRMGREKEGERRECEDGGEE